MLLSITDEIYHFLEDTFMPSLLADTINLPYVTVSVVALPTVVKISMLQVTWDELTD